MASKKKKNSLIFCSPLSRVNIVLLHSSNDSRNASTKY